MRAEADGKEQTLNAEGALAVNAGGDRLALQTAIHLWAVATTGANSYSRADLMQCKRRAVASFFDFVAGKSVDEVKPADVERWRVALEQKGFQPATVYSRVSRLSSFYEWMRRDPALGRLITINPVQQARPKPPKAYQTESTKSLDDEQMTALLGAVARQAQKSGAARIVGKRDYALLLFFIATGMRRREVLELRGADVEPKTDRLIIRGRVKGGDYVGREVKDAAVRAALLDYLEVSGRNDVIGSPRPIWTRHDRAGRAGAQLSSHAFAKNLKKYAKQIGLDSIHIHQTRHTFARIVAEESGSLVETQEALGHRNLATTRVYVQRITIKRDKHGSAVLARFGVSSPNDTPPPSEK